MDHGTPATNQRYGHRAERLEPDKLSRVADQPVVHGPGLTPQSARQVVAPEHHHRHQQVHKVGAAVTKNEKRRVAFRPDSGAERKGPGTPQSFTLQFRGVESGRQELKP